MTDNSIISGTRKEIIDEMNNLERNADGTDTTNYDGEFTNVINILPTSSNQDEKKHYLFHFVT